MTHKRTSCIIIIKDKHKTKGGFQDEEKTSFEEQPLSDRTLSGFRARVLAYETEHDAEKLIELCDKTADLDDTSEYQHLITLN